MVAPRRGGPEIDYHRRCTHRVPQTLAPQVGAGVLAALQSPQFPPVEPLLTALLNELAAIADHFVLVLDDYHVIDAKAVDQALAYLLMHLPPQMHLIIATREDPPLPLARLRAQGQLTKLRAADLRFTAGEAAEFLNRVMALRLTAGDIAALETRTEGWIAGLQLAALALQGLAQHGQQALALARQYEQVIDRFILCEVFLARVRLAQGDVDGAAALLAQADQSARQRNFVLRLPEIAAARVPVLEPWRRQAEARAWEDERLKAMVLEAVALQA